MYQSYERDLRIIHRISVLSFFVWPWKGY